MKQRKDITSYGPRRGGVRVIRERGLYLVCYRDFGGRRRYKSFTKVVEAKAWAEAYWLGKLDRKKPALTVRQLWERYKAAEFHLLRPRTRFLYAQRFQWWEDFLTPSASAESVTLETISRFRSEMKKAGQAVNQTRAIVTVAKVVWNWGELAEHVQRNALGRYRFKLGKDEKVNRPDAFTLTEYQKIIATVNPRNPYQWRPWALLTLLGNQGVRANAALHLRWADVDFEAGGITWRSAYDKMGNEWWQPLLQPTREALLVALGYAKGSVWVFPCARPTRGKNEVYTIQALTDALRKAEGKAGVRHKTLRANHGLRRMVVNRVRKMTDDPAAALRFVGDTDLRQATSYVRIRNDELAGIAALLDTESATQLPTETEGSLV